MNHSPLSAEDTTRLNLGITGTIFNIQRFSTHDGPGIRTTVFLKGCSLRCFWCHNPEGIRGRLENEFYVERCIGCGKCVVVCPQMAQTLDVEGRAYDGTRCLACGRCVAECFAEALVAVGQHVTAAEVLSEILRDRAFYERSGGGVTLSGGEPALQPAFARAILELCRAAGIHTAVETAAHCPWEDLAELLPATDLLMLDIKLMDPASHHAATGATNRQVLANARRLALTELPLLVHVPVVPGVNDTPQAIGAIAAFVRELVALRATGAPPSLTLAPIEMELLPFHQLASDKYRSLGLEYRAAGFSASSANVLLELAAVARAAGVAVRNH